MHDLDRHTAAVRMRLDALQWGAASSGDVVFLPVPCGLGGQITGRIQTLLLALALGRRAVFQTLDDPPYGQTFDAMHPPADPGGSRETWPLADLLADQQELVVCYDPARMAVHGPQADAAIMARVAEGLGVTFKDRLVLEGMIFNWMKATGEMARYCSEQRLRLGIGRDTLGVHFRRGDKAVETAFVPAREYNRRIACLHETWAFTSLFLASDSPDACSEIQCPPGVRLIFDNEELRYNNANHKMLIRAPELIHQETRVAFKNIALLAQCGGVIGQDNAHFATLSAASIAARDWSVERTDLIDGRIAERQSMVLSAYFQGKKVARAAVRRLFPQLTTVARMKRP